MTTRQSKVSIDGNDEYVVDDDGYVTETFNTIAEFLSNALSGPITEIANELAMGTLAIDDYRRPDFTNFKSKNDLYRMLVISFFNYILKVYRSLRVYEDIFKFAKVNYNDHMDILVPVDELEKQNFHLWIREVGNLQWATHKWYHERCSLLINLYGLLPNRIRYRVHIVNEDFINNRRVFIVSEKLFGRTT